MPARKFKSGDFVCNVNPNSAHYARIKDKVGIFKRYWSDLCTVNEACDVEYGVDDAPEPLILAQAVCDLELVEGYHPSEHDPFNWMLNGRTVRICPEWRTCGRKVCKKCYPSSGKVYHSHGPYYIAYWYENGKRTKQYVGTTLPPLMLVTNNEAAKA